MVEAAEKRRAPEADGQQTAEDDDGIDADASGAGPIGIRLQVQPQRKLVQCERGAHTVAYGHEAAEKNGKLGVIPPQVKQPSVTDQQQNENAPHQVMNVEAVHRDPLERAMLMHDQPNQNADAQKGDEERDRGNEHAPPGTVGNGGANENAQPGEMQKHQQHHDDHGGKREQ